MGCTCHSNVQISVLKCDVLEAVNVFKSAIFSIFWQYKCGFKYEGYFGHFIITCFVTA